MKRRCPDHVTQKMVAALRKNLKKCDRETLELFHADAPVLFKNNNFLEYERIARDLGKWIPEDDSDSSSDEESKDEKPS